MVSTALYLGLLALVALERLGELVLSRRNLRRALARGGHEVESGSFVPMALLHALFLPACAAEVLLLPVPWPASLSFIALAYVLAAQALRYWAVATLGEHWNVRIVVVPGDKPILAGPYRYLRHPNYLAVVVEFAAIPMVKGAWITALVFSALNALVLRRRIRTEEEALGAEYARLFAATPRIVPRPAR